VTILVSVNPDKKCAFSTEEKIFLIEKSIPDDLKKKVKVIPYA
jgi:phosphopantetheine adenylyltransferase